VAEQGAGHADAEHLQADPCDALGARNTTTTTAKSRPRRAPPPEATARPRRFAASAGMAAFRKCGGRKPAKAPIAMMPSQPRLKTPDRWLNISPVEASRRATEKGTPRVRMLSAMSSRFIVRSPCLPRRRRL
jgi:hypothetical protein